MIAHSKKEIPHVLEPIVPNSRKRNNLSKTRKPVLPKSFIPTPPQEGDEYMVNGVFYFNISKMIDDIEHDRCDFTLEEIDVPEWTSESSERNLRKNFIEMADLSKPVILAEIAPDRLIINPQIPPGNWRERGYNLLDGHHRVVKASHTGTSILKAYCLPMESHIRYMYKGLDIYKQYWDEKCKFR
jgi:hypothetical protein